MTDNDPMPELDPDVRVYYEEGEEASRLFGGFPSGPLERTRTQEILDRYLPPGPLEVLDVGGGPGAYAAWLAERATGSMSSNPSNSTSSRRRRATRR
jgi:ubiquinone/menaquinone biosynthesis C-methylase UbiE